MARLLSVNVGLPRDIAWKGRTVHTGIWKTPVGGRRRVGRLNLDGDGQGDLAGHGGEQRAVFVYQIESYRYWQDQLKRTDFVHGQFGENFTIEGLPDDAVCIGDRYQIGSALFEITQPRVTCYRVAIRMNEPRMPALLTSSGRPGFYFRVLQEGEVGGGDEIVKVGETKERITVAEINALLYLPNHPRDQLERALRIEALSPGWRSSFEALLQSQTTAEGSGNAALAPAAAAHPVAPGFRRLAVAAIDQECADVLSLTMQSLDGRPLPTALPGQYVVLRLPRTPGDTLFRSYSLSGPASTERYRISVKIEPNGEAGSHLREHVRLGDALDVSSPRGSFIPQPGERPVVLLSAGIGATPVLAMLYTLAAVRSTRQVLWLYAARDRQHHPFAAEVRRLMLALAHSRSYVCYSRPGSRDKIGEDFDATGHLSRSVFDEVGIPRAGAIHWQSSFHVSDRVASRESVGRVVLAGDAAHVHAPVAARGMNLGIEDAFVFAHCAVEALHGNLKRLSDYGLMRHEVHARVVARVDRLTRLARGQPAIVGLPRRLMPAITTFGPTHRSMVELVTGLDHPIKVDLS